MGQILQVTYLCKSIGMSIIIVYEFSKTSRTTAMWGVSTIVAFGGTIAMWGVSAIVAFGGIVLLSEEHKS